MHHGSRIADHSSSGHVSCNAALQFHEANKQPYSINSEIWSSRPESSGTWLKNYCGMLHRNEWQGKAFRNKLQEDGFNSERNGAYGMRIARGFLNSMNGKRVFPEINCKCRFNPEKKCSVSNHGKCVVVKFLNSTNGGGKAVVRNSTCVVQSREQ